MASSQITTILLLVAVGAVLYYLTQNKVDKNEQPLLQENNLLQPEFESFRNVREHMENEPLEEPIERPMELPVNNKESQESQETEFIGMGNLEGASSIDAAFGSAVPENTAVDQVDFNRNNVTEYDSAQYLPKEVNDEWFDTDFTKAKYNLNDDKMINTNRYMIGVNTVGQSLKNPAYDIRGTIPNPKYTISPWNNSTYEPDNNLKPLC